MKFFIFASIFSFSLAVQAASLCEAYATKPRFYKALETVAAYQDMTMDEFCHRPNVLSIEVQPNRIITREGEIVPHVRVELHSSSYSCSFLVRDADLAVTGSHCYSTF